MKYKLKNKKNNTYYTSTIFLGQYHWTFEEPYIFNKKWDAIRKLKEIVSIKRLTIDDLIIESVKW